MYDCIMYDTLSLSLVGNMTGANQFTLYLNLKSHNFVEKMMLGHEN